MFIPFRCDVCEHGEYLPQDVCWDKGCYATTGKECEQKFERKEERIQSVQWNKIKLKSKEPNLPPIGKQVLWAKSMAGYNRYFRKFFGKITASGKLDTGTSLLDLTSDYYWIDLEDPKE